MALYRIDQLINLYDGYRTVLSIAGYSIIVMQIGAQRTAFLNQCPHQQRPLQRGSLQGSVLRCPSHGYSFDVLTGQPTDQTPRCGELKHVPLVCDGLYLCVEL